MRAGRVSRGRCPGRGGGRGGGRRARRRACVQHRVDVGEDLHEHERRRVAHKEPVAIARGQKAAVGRPRARPTLLRGVGELHYHNQSLVSLRLGFFRRAKKTKLPNKK